MPENQNIDNVNIKVKVTAPRKQTLQKINDTYDALKRLNDEVAKNGGTSKIANVKSMANATTSAASGTAALGTAIKGLKWGALLYGAKKGVQLIGDWVTQSNEYVENLNLFTVTMGKYAKEAYEYGRTVESVMGIDLSEWIRGQGVFNQIALGFGIAEDKAYTMSKGLTQLSYDLASFFNLDTEEAMNKVRSGIAGELEPLRNLGYALDQATLKQVALDHGITKSISSMTQAEKAQLRYIAIMEQSKNAVGDMARTLMSPANAQRILTAQTDRLKRSLGQLFTPLAMEVIPVLTAITQLTTELVQNAAALVGFELPKIEDVESDKIADSWQSATESAKEYQRTILGFDQINKMNGATDTIGNAMGGDLGLDLSVYDYDFLGKANEKVEEIKDKLIKMSPLIEGIATGLALWKITGFLSDLTSVTTKTNYLSELGVITIGISLAVTGTSLFGKGLEDAAQSEIDKINFADMIVGTLLTDTAAFILGSGVAAWITKAFGGTVLTDALATLATNLGVSTAGIALGSLVTAFSSIALGIPMLFVGLKDSFEQGLNLLNAIIIELGTTIIGGGVGTILAAVGVGITGPIGALIGAGVGLIFNGIIKTIQDLDAPWWAQLIAPGLMTTVETVAKLVEVIRGNLTWKEAFIDGETTTTKTLKGYKNITDKSPYASNSVSAEISEEELFAEWEKWRPKGPFYATGGFPEDGLFFANHNEMVGKFTNGKTAVANNAQIVSGIASGVRDANSAQNELLREQNALLRQLIGVTSEKIAGVTTHDIVKGAQRMNRREGTTIIPVG